MEVKMFGFGKKKKQSEPSFEDIAKMTKRVNKATKELDITTMQFFKANEKMLASVKKF